MLLGLLGLELYLMQDRVEVTFLEALLCRLPKNFLNFVEDNRCLLVRDPLDADSERPLACCVVEAKSRTVVRRMACLNQRLVHETVLTFEHQLSEHLKLESLIWILTALVQQINQSAACLLVDRRHLVRCEISVSLT